MKTHPVDRCVVRLWLLREICLFLSGRISSGKFDDDFFGGTKFKLIANDPTCHDVAYVFWSFYDDFKDQPWPPYPFLSQSDRNAAREQFLLHREEYVPKFIPQSVYDIYIAPFEEQASSRA